MLKPLRSNVLLKPIDMQSSSPSGLILANNVINEAVVVAKGMDVKELKVGDVVRYDAGSIVKLDSKSVNYVMCREADVLCVVEQ